MTDNLPPLSSKPDKESWNPPRGWITKEEPKKSKRPIILTVLGAMFVLGLFLPDSDPGPSIVEYDHFIQNNADQRILYVLYVDGAETCGGELNTGTFSGIGPCSFEAESGTHGYILEIAYADGGYDREEWSMSERVIGFYVTHWGLQARTE